MYCKKCGNQLNTGALFCSNCGEAVSGSNQENQSSSNLQSDNGMQSISNTQMAVNVQSNVVSQPNNQQMINQQQMMYQPNVSSSQKNSNKIFIVIVIICIVVIGILLWILFFKDGNVDDIKVNDSAPSIKEGGKGSNEVVSNNNQIDFNGYKVTIPTGVSYKISDDGWLVITDSTRALAAVLRFVIDDYNSVKANPNVIIDKLKEFGVNAIYSLKTYEGREYLTFKFNSDNINETFFESKLSSTDVAFGYVYEFSNYNESIAYGYITKIIDGVKSNGNASKFSIEMPKNTFNEDFFKKINE